VPLQIPKNSGKYGCIARGRTTKIVANIQELEKYLSYRRYKFTNIIRNPR
jgi:hypothetical protein